MSIALSGVTPEGADILNVAGADGRTTAYIYNGLTYVRTPLTLLSPAWSGSVSSADGMKVYALDETPVVLLSDKGRMVRAYLTAREESKNE
jgi:intracellular multiplication protein IcmK